VLCAVFTSASVKAEVLEGHFRSRPPEMVVSDGGEMSGPLKDVIEEAARRCGDTVHWSIVPFARSLVELQNGAPVVVPRLRRTPDRETFAIFLGPISIQHRPVKFAVVKGRGSKLTRYEDLASMTVAILPGSATFSRFDADAGLKKHEAADDESRARMLQAGRVDAIVSSDVHALDTAFARIGFSHWEWADYKVYIQSGNYYGIAKTGPLATRAGVLNAALKAMADSGEVREIYHRYGLDPTKIAE
jgi:polar amino acid transport system substrate-binding protein